MGNLYVHCNAPRQAVERVLTSLSNGNSNNWIRMILSPNYAPLFSDRIAYSGSLPISEDYEAEARISVSDNPFYMASHNPVHSIGATVMLDKKSGKPTVEAVLSRVFSPEDGFHIAEYGLRHTINESQILGIPNVDSTLKRLDGFDLETLTVAMADDSGALKLTRQVHEGNFYPILTYSGILTETAISLIRELIVNNTAVRVALPGDSEYWQGWVEKEGHPEIVEGWKALAELNPENAELASKSSIRER